MQVQGIEVEYTSPDVAVPGSACSTPAGAGGIAQIVSFLLGDVPGREQPREQRMLG